MTVADTLYNEFIWYPNDWIHKSIEDLSNLVDASHQAVITAIQDLEEEGLLEVKACQYDRRKNKYRVTAPWEQQPKDLTKYPEREGRASRPPFNTDCNTEEGKVDPSPTYDGPARWKNHRNTNNISTYNKGTFGKPTRGSTDPPSSLIPWTQLFRWIPSIPLDYSPDGSESSTPAPPTATPSKDSVATTEGLGSTSTPPTATSPKGSVATTEKHGNYRMTTIQQILGFDLRVHLPRRDVPSRYDGTEIAVAWSEGTEAQFDDHLFGRPNMENIVPDTSSESGDYDQVMDEWMKNDSEEVFVNGEKIGTRQGSDWSFTPKEDYLDKETIEEAMNQLNGSLSEAAQSRIQAVKEQAYHRRDLPLKYWIRRRVRGTEVDHDDPYGYFQLFREAMQYARLAPNGYSGHRVEDFNDLDGRTKGQFKHLCNKTDVQDFVNAVEYGIKAWEDLPFDGRLTLGLVLDQYQKWSVEIGSIEGRGTTDDETLDESDLVIMEEADMDDEVGEDFAIMEEPEMEDVEEGTGDLSDVEDLF